jgi:hypothetical protein
VNRKQRKSWAARFESVLLLFADAFRVIDFLQISLCDVIKRRIVVVTSIKRHVHGFTGERVLYLVAAAAVCLFLSLVSRCF